ncbi:hypothetical protein [Phreatobacter stygius]|uniref:Uncharacterized protein n=1 Tax=Phreatobacter stygius TaxID=1940610 RepID=A0A4D7BL49_9HYPH|nr:hypothetical protein [Phreatobacter stygius]QCI68457.1 hypothetical protein E8M01_32065 [Phreatobacter stygius]
MKRLLFLALAAALSATPAFAQHHHGSQTGPNGGTIYEMADTYHVEVVAKGTALDIYLSDHDDKAVSAAGFQGVAILVVDGKSVRVTLAPAGANRLTGTSTVALPQRPRGAVQLTPPGRRMIQAQVR